MTFEACASKILAEEKKDNGFELLGYDFMIDEDLKVWLIEVNMNPCLSTLSPKQRVLIDNLVNDIFR